MMKHRNFNIAVFIFTISIVVGLVNMLPVILAWLKTPPGFTNLLTGHYFADYFTYLQAIAQGMRGAWIVENPYATDENARLFGWWPYLLIGRIGGLLHLSPQGAYWTAVFVLSVIFAICSYYIIDRLLKRESFTIKLSAFLLFLSAAPFTLNHDYWYAPNFLFRRFGNIPYHLLASILTLILIVMAGRIVDKLERLSYRDVITQSIVISLLSALLLTFSPFNTALVVVSTISALIITGWKKAVTISPPRGSLAVVGHPRGVWGLYVIRVMVFLGIMFVLLIPTAVTLKISMSAAGPIARASLWEQSLAPFYPNIIQLVLIFGPVFLLAIFGVRNYIRNLNGLKLTALFFTIFSLVLFYSPLAKLLGTHHWRFINPVDYVVFAVLAVCALPVSPPRGNPAVVGHPRGGRHFVYIIIVVLVIYGLVVNGFFLKKQLIDPNLSTKISVLPDDIFNAFTILDTRGESGSVLTATNQYMGLIVPIYSRRRVYVAREISTPAFWEKVTEVNDFFSGKWDEDQARAFFTKNQLRFVILTSVDEYSPDNLKKYSFLRNIYKGRHTVIFIVQ